MIDSNNKDIFSNKFIYTFRDVENSISNADIVHITNYKDPHSDMLHYTP